MFMVQTRGSVVFAFFHALALWVLILCAGVVLVNIPRGFYKGMAAGGVLLFLASSYIGMSGDVAPTVAQHAEAMHELTNTVLPMVLMLAVPLFGFAWWLMRRP